MAGRGLTSGGCWEELTPQKAQLLGSPEQEDIVGLFVERRWM